MQGADPSSIANVEKDFLLNQFTIIEPSLRVTTVYGARPTISRGNIVT